LTPVGCGLLTLERPVVTKEHYLGAFRRGHIRMQGRFLTVAVLGLCLSGCVSSQKITSRTVGYNKVVEDSNNQVLLVHVERAPFRHPMYFTGLRLLRGSQSVQVGTGSTLPFGGGAPSIYTANPNASLNINPSYDVAVLDTKEFMSGITTPVDM